jgi:hypothetical protein
VFPAADIFSVIRDQETTGCVTCSNQFPVIRRWVTARALAPLVFLVRRPHLAIVSHHSARLNELDAIAAAAAEFVDLCITVDTWLGPTKVIFYEDFIADDKPIVGAAVEGLMAGFKVVSFAAQLRTFLNHLEHHRARSYLSLERERTRGGRHRRGPSCGIIRAQQNAPRY